MQKDAALIGRYAFDHVTANSPSHIPEGPLKLSLNPDSRIDS